MIYIVSEHITPRLQYICQVFFDNILQTDFKIISQFADISTDDAIIWYHGEKLQPSHIAIPAYGLLSENNIHLQSAAFSPDLLKMYFKDERFEGYDFDFDIFSAAFYLITSYELYANPIFDWHGRYDENKYATFKNHAHRLPLLNIWAEELWRKIIEKYPTQKRKNSQFSFKISFDIDSPYLFKGRTFVLQTAGIAKNILLLQWKQAGSKLQIWVGKKDPYDVYEYIFSLCEMEKLVFFFLLDRHSPNDTRYTYHNMDYRRLIKDISEKGISLGIHPSYFSFLDEKMLRFEKKQLDAIVNAKTNVARMHFLKYRLPETYIYLEEIGILHDYTACTVETPGFKNFIARPFLWFNLVENKVTTLTIHPTMVMDRTLEAYMKKDADKAFEVIKEYIDITAEYNGEFIPLFHNSTLGELNEWKGWRQVFEKTVRYLQDKTKK